MQIILLEDIPKLGHKYEIKQVASGYGRNFLLPQNKAILATDSNLTQYEKLRVKEEADRLDKKTRLATLLDKAGEITVKLKAKANDQGHLFAGIYAKDITEALNDHHGLSIDPEALILDQPIKIVGEHQVGLKQKPTAEEPSAYLKVEVVATIEE